MGWVFQERDYSSTYALLLHYVLSDELSKCYVADTILGIIHILYILLLENEKFFELKSKGYRDGIKRKETR